MFIQIAARYLLLLFLLAPFSGFPQTTDISVTLTEGTNMAAAVSPDQKTIAFDLQGIVWLMPADGGKARPLTDELGDCHQPVWSPDGSTLAFQSYRGNAYHIWTIGKDGTNLKQVTQGIHDDREPDYSRDGQRIAFSSDRSGSSNIWEVNVKTGKMRQLTQGKADYHPKWSPDGKRLLYVSDLPKHGIYLFENNQTKLVFASDQKLAAPAWGSKPGVITFVAFERGKSKLIRFNMPDQKQELLSQAADDIFPFPVSALASEQFVFTANGKIYRQREHATSRKEIPFSATVQLQKSAYTHKSYNFDQKTEKKVLGILGPALAPDGNRVAFTALGDIYIQEPGKPAFRITDDPAVDLDPEWSPDGKSIAFVSDRDGSMDLWLMDLGTKKSRKLATGSSDQILTSPALSKDGKRIAYYTKNTLNEWGTAILKSIDVQTGEIKTYSQPIFTPGKPSWSGDGKTIALSALLPFSTRYREGHNIFLMISTETGDKRFVVPDSMANRGMRTRNGPVWSPDGTRIAYVQEGALFTMKVRENGAMLEKPVKVTAGLVESISWSGDSQHILFQSSDQLKKVNISSGKVEAVSIQLTYRPQQNHEEYLIHAGRIFNGRDSIYQHQMDILVSGNRIREIRPHRDHGTTKVIDATGQVVMPGLFEMHSHQHASWGRKLGNNWLANGITTVREPGADPYDGLERKESWNAGARPGPRLFTTGGLMEGSRAFYGLSNPIATQKQAAQELERAKKLDYDLLKTYVRFPDSLQKFIVTEGHRIGLPVSSHEIFPATKYNIDAVEHFRGTSRRGYSPKQTELNLIYNDVFQILKASGISITPTIVMHEGFLKLIKQDSALTANPQFNTFFSKTYISNWKERATPDKYGPNFEEFQRAVRKVVSDGGRVVAGTDSPFVPYGTSLHTELWLYVDGGLSPFQALQTAGIRAAEALHIDKDLGSIEAGKLADLLIISGDPLLNIRHTLNIETVIKNGTIYQMKDLLKGF